MVDGTHGDWQTDSADYQKQRDDRNFIMVGHEALRATIQPSKRTPENSIRLGTLVYAHICQACQDPVL